MTAVNEKIREALIESVAEAIFHYEDKPPGPPDPPWSAVPEGPVKRSYRRKAQEVLAALMEKAKANDGRER